MSLSISDDNKRTFGALALISLGVLMLLGLSKLWPLFILLPGLGIMYWVVNGGKDTGVLAVPGMLVAGTGGLLLFQSVTGYWESWIYAWTLYGVFFGVGLMLMGEKMEIKDLRVIGRWFTIISGVAFVGFGGLVLFITSAFIRVLFIIACFVVGFRLLSNNGSKKVAIHTNGNGYKAKHSDYAGDETVAKMRVRLGEDEIV